MEANERHELDSQRLELLARLEDWLETPMLVLAFAWLALLVVELVHGESHVFDALGVGIWVIFVVDFALKLVLAPARGRYLRTHWLTALSLLLPALRVFRVARTFRLLRFARAQSGVRLIRVLGSINRGMRALGASFARRGFGYVLGLTLIVMLSGAAGMYAFEKDAPGQAGFSDFGTALWWTAMLLTTMGSELWPRSPEGRLLCILLAIYAFAMLGYVTAAIATFFVGRDAEDDVAEIAGARSVAELRAEIASLRAAIEVLGTKRPN